MTQCWRHFNKKSGMIPRKNSCEIRRGNLRRILTRNSWRIIRWNIWRILMNKSWKNSRRKNHEGFQKKGFPKVTQGFPQGFSEWFQEGAPGGYPTASTGWLLEQTPIGLLDGTLEGNAVWNPEEILRTSLMGKPQKFRKECRRNSWNNHCRSSRRNLRMVIFQRELLE